MRIAVVGAGALGLYYGALLQRSGNEVLFLLRHDYEAITSRGLTIRSVSGDFHLDKVKGYRAPGEIGTVDLILVGLKTFSNCHYQELISPILGESTVILTLQNGLGNEEVLASLFGGERILGGVAFLCSNRVEPGVVNHLGEGRILIGDYQGDELGRVERIADLFCRSGVECKAVTDLKKARWEKLVWNIPFNGTCALLKLPVNVVLANARTKNLIRSIMIEVISAANAQSLSVPIENSFADRMIQFTEPMGSYKPSMLIDREQGRQLELAAIFGVPLAAGEARGVKMPCIEALYALLELTAST